MNIKLIAHTQLSWEFASSLGEDDDVRFEDGQAVALTAIRTCYSANKPSEIVTKEGARYFGNGGSEASRLIRHIVASKHTSTLEHLSFTFAVEDVSRALLAQLTRHRVGFSYSVQSQRYVRMGSDDKTGGFGYVVPAGVDVDVYEDAMHHAQQSYDLLRQAGIPAEDARMVLPNAATTNLVMTANMRALLDFYAKRRAGNGAQAEIAELAEELRKAVVVVEPWTDEVFAQC